MAALCVELSEYEAPDLERVKRQGWPERGGLAWRIVWKNTYPIPVPFARRRDAERALAAIVNAIDWDTDRESVKQSVKNEIGQEGLLRLMTECLAW